jgi:hypothetical protein
VAGAFFRGVGKLRQKFATIARKLPIEIGRALRVEVEIESKEVKRRTPVDQGTLRGTVHVEGPFYEGRMIRMMIVAGGPAAPYAIYVHEDLEAFHKVGQAKYLESVIFESRPHMAARVARRVELSRAV